MSVFKPFNPLGRMDSYQLHLPHWRQEGCTYFITWRLGDAIPQDTVEKWRTDKEAWLATRGLPQKIALEMLPAPLRREYHARFTARMERWMDAGHGACQLRHRPCAKVVEDALRHFDGERYRLDGFVIMPNHVHVLVMPLGGWQLESLAHSWKSFTAHRINEVLHRTGALWMDEVWDHIVRSWAQMEKFRAYMEANPVKAGLRPGDYVLGRGRGVERG